jgi:hypothetical protein
MSHEWVTAIAAVISVVVAVISAVVAIAAMRGQNRLGVQQQAMERDIAAKHSDLEVKLANQQQAFQAKLNETDRLYSQRAQLLPLWQYISQLNHIDPKKPVTPDIMRAVNALELVALCCEATIIDPAIVRRTFRQTYIELYEEIEQVGEVPGMNKKSGTTILRENPAAQKWYHEFKREIMTQDQIKPI